MRQFNAPPGWPDPPNARWRPPKDWGPSESWPPAPAGWRFWVDENGRPVRGPIGRYGGPSVVKLGSAAAAVLVLIGLVLFNPFSGDDSATTSGSPAAVETTPLDGATTDPGTETMSPNEPPASGATEEPTAEPTQTPSTTPGESPTATPSTPEPSSPEPSSPTTAQPTTTASATGAVVYRSCAEVRAAGKAPLYRGQPGYSAELDRNGDGIACDRGNS